MSGTTGEGYRADIDGLRAIAVLSVLAFHAFPDLVPGGFTGVDIFFSISGFLITGIILQAIDADTFTFAQFYGRRIRRIFPALLAMFAVTIIAGRFVLLVREYQSLGLHVAAGSIFTSNFLLWSEAGYFDLAAHYKPLLHLWSLGVEEQFYLFWPLMLLIVPGRFGLRLIATVFLALASYYACRHIFVTDPTANFYSPLTRWWELMIGALLAQTIRLPVTASIDKIPLLGILIRNVASTAGAAMIVFGLAFKICSVSAATRRHRHDQLSALSLALAAAGVRAPDERRRAHGLRKIGMPCHCVCTRCGDLRFHRAPGAENGAPQRTTARIYHGGIRLVWLMDVP